MEEKVIRQLKGHSGSQIFLMQNTNGLFIRKVGNVERNFERLTDLYSNFYPVPVIYQKQDEVLDMEYIHGLDMKTYLLSGDLNHLTKFIIDTLNKFAKNAIIKDYTDVYEKKLEWLHKEPEIPFTKEELIARLPKKLPCSQYHGDLTLENILYSNQEFHMIDAVTIEYDSYVFDIAKLRQDLECKWFLRDTKTLIDVKLKNLQESLLDRFSGSDNNYLLILMLLRVFLHTKPNDDDRKFILKEIHRLWK